jgi:cystathionine gamma-lyase
MSDRNEDKLKFETLAVHAGVHPDPTTGAIMTPIYATSTYIQKSPGVHQGYDYSRTDNPTRTALQESLAAIEGGKFALATSSGVTAIDVIMHLLESGDEVVSCDDVYGGTSRLFRTIWSKHGIKTHFADMTQNNFFQQNFAKAKIIWIETPTNPLLKIIDIQRVVEWAKKQAGKPLVVVDNTFASPYFQRPLELGADIVLHSTTKYINGHSDTVGGALIINSKELKEKLHHNQNSMGGVPGNLDSWLVLRGIKTLALRMQRHEENAMQIAEFLESHKNVEKVLYPGLKSHPQYEVAKKQMRGFAGIVTFFIKGDLAVCRKFLEKVKVFSLAESLGGVESLVDHPAIMTHASIPKETRASLGISDNLVRLSVGIESIDDLKRDLNQAL